MNEKFCYSLKQKVKKIYLQLLRISLLNEKYKLFNVFLTCMVIIVKTIVPCMACT